MRRLFFDNERRLRTAWRLGGFVAILVLLQSSLLLLVSLVFDFRSFFQGPLASSDAASLVSHAVSMVATTAAVYLARRWLDRRSFPSLGVALDGPWLAHLVAGILLGIGLLAGIFVAELATGWTHIERVGWTGTGGLVEGLAIMFLVFVAVGWNEELLSRGYLLQNLKVGLGTPAAVILSSTIFGALHIFNSNSSVAATIGVAMAGLLFAVAYLVTRTLWLAIGLHIGWNFAEGPLFGFPVSGLEAGGLISHRVDGPEAITGGAFGPEAGLISVIAELIGIALLWFWTRRRHTTESTTAPANSHAQ